MLRRKALAKRLRKAPSAKQELIKQKQLSDANNSEKPILGTPLKGRAGVVPGRTSSERWSRYHLSGFDTSSLISSRVARILSIALKPVKVVPPTRRVPLSRTLRSRRRRSISLAQSRLLSRQGDISKLRSCLYDRDATLVSIDTESERQGLLNHVVEIGVSLLRTRDIHNVEPGRYAQNWVDKLEHHHIVVDVTKRPKHRMAGSLFGTSLFLSASQARNVLSATIQSVRLDSGPGGVIFVGHSVGGDIEAVLKDPGLTFDLLNRDDARNQKQPIFDTCGLAQAAVEGGACLPRLNLEYLVRTIGIHPRYFQKGALRGWHNASNDAAYTMMLLLLFGVHWQDLLQGRSPSTLASLAASLPEKTIPESPEPGSLRVARWRGAVESALDRKKRKRSVSWTWWIRSLFRRLFTLK